MKPLTKEMNKSKYDSSSIDLLILAVSFAFTALIAFVSNKLTSFENFFLFYGTGAIFLFYILRWEFPLIRNNRKHIKSLLIIGNGKQAKTIAREIIHGNSSGVKLAGLISDEYNFEQELKMMLEKEKIDEILLFVETEDYKEIFNMIDICNQYRVSVKLCSELFSIICSKIHSESYFGIPVIDVTLHNHVKYYNIIKRVVDVSIAVLALISLSPLIIFIATIIKLTSKGPVIYCQKRVGLNGRIFDFYKFRSMNVNEGEDEKRKAMMLNFISNNQSCKIIDEERVTSIGRIIRKTSLDELPQLYNVIRGDMSIVGPRPCLRYEFEQYTEWQKRRVNGMPGCTGIWQVSGRSNVSFKDSIILDLYYLMKMSPVYDIKLILKTIPVMLFSRGGK